MSAAPLVGDLVEVLPVRTVIRLVEGREQSGEIASSFVFTPEVAAHISVLAEALASLRGQGYFLQGDFGSGKSHFLAAVYALLADTEARDALAGRHAGLERLAGGDLRHLPVAVSLVDFRAERPLEDILLGAVEEELGRRVSDASFVAQARAADRRETLGAVVSGVRAAGYAGIVFLIDELSEFFRSKPTPQSLNEDARTLQLLGEMAGSEPIWIIAAVQESLEQTGDISQVTFRKIKDRFPMKLVLSTLHIRSLISGRLVRHRPGADKAILAIYEQYRSLFRSFDCPFDAFRDAYPVHPVTIDLLDGLGGLFSQHRGIVDFVHARLAGDEGRSIPSILARPATALLAPDSIYDHFSGRLAEFSAFNVYVRHIVPHLQRVTQDVLESQEDRDLALRAVKMLVLYRIHPTASEPPVVELAELAACSLELGSGELSAQYLSEAVLDPVANAGRFVVKKPGAEDLLTTVYEVVTEDDPGKTLDSRIGRARAEIAGEDSRLLLLPLGRLGESESWPGSALLAGGVRRSVSWLSSTRSAMVQFAHTSEDVPPLPRDADFRAVLTLSADVPEDEHTAIWHIPPPEAEQREVLLDYLAACMTQEELDPSNPAEAGLVPLVRERVERLHPAAAQVALETVYAGGFTDRRIRVDPAVRQLKRFDQLIEAAAQTLLDQRFPRFREVAPRRYAPSARTYQQLLTEFVVPGSIPLGQARNRSLSGAIDGLAVPLGLVELRRGSYVFSPDTAGHPLVSFVFALLDPAQPTPMAEALDRLEHGVFGLPRDTALFLLATLAAGGLLVVRRKGRSIPLEMLSATSVEQADEIAPGELVTARDRATLLEECDFLLGEGEQEAFGLRQQREAWKEVVRFRASGEVLEREVTRKLDELGRYTAFRAFDLGRVREKLQGLQQVVNEIKVSHGAKEGLERFLGAWRGSGLTAADVHTLRGYQRFLSRGADEFVFMSHYAHHETVGTLSRSDDELEDLQRGVLDILERPEEGIIGDGGENLRQAFGLLRDRYVAGYGRLHDEHVTNQAAPTLSKQTTRALGVLTRLSGVEGLDRPEGLVDFLARLSSRSRGGCTRQVSEELLRSPVCGCGFVPGEAPVAVVHDQPESRITGFLSQYADILRSSRVQEALAARAYALSDADPELSQRLGLLRETLGTGSVSAARLADLCDDATLTELGEALTGSLTLHRRDLGDLERVLAGRRLPADRLRHAFDQWVGAVEEDGLVAVEGGGGEPPLPEAAALAWWPDLHDGLFDSLGSTGGSSADAVVELQTALAERFPAAGIAKALATAEARQVWGFVATERFHTAGIEQGWRVLAQRVLAAEELPEGLSIRSMHVHRPTRDMVQRRLRSLADIVASRRAPLPQRLAARIPIEEVMRDPWADAVIQTAARSLLESTSELGEAWLKDLQSLPALELEDGPVVLVVDGAPVDVWISHCGAVSGVSGRTPTVEWFRLEVDPSTPEALASLLGLPGDPLEHLAARGIPYHTLSGSETPSIDQLVDIPAPPAAVVVRLALLDRLAHRGQARLADLVTALESMLSRHLPPLVEMCERQRRRLVVTTDHGLSLSETGLTHGGGGVYERAVFRAQWMP